MLIILSCAFLLLFISNIILLQSKFKKIRNKYFKLLEYGILDINYFTSMNKKAKFYTKEYKKLSILANQEITLENPEIFNIKDDNGNILYSVKEN